MQKVSALSAQFCHELKPTLKKLSIKRKKKRRGKKLPDPPYRIAVFEVQ